MRISSVWLLLRDDFRIGPGEYLRAVNMIAMKMGINDVADGQCGDFSEIVEDCRAGAWPSVVSTTTTLRSVKMKMTLPKA